MSYAIHNFQPKHILTAAEMNEMDAQIALNEQASQDAATAAEEAVQAAEDAADGSVGYTAQSKTDTEKETARKNIGAVKVTDSGLGIIIGE